MTCIEATHEDGRTIFYKLEKIILFVNAINSKWFTKPLANAVGYYCTSGMRRLRKRFLHSIAYLLMPCSQGVYCVQEVAVAAAPIQDTEHKQPEVSAGQLQEESAFDPDSVLADAMFEA